MKDKHLFISSVVGLCVWFSLPCDIIMGFLIMIMDNNEYACLFRKQYHNHLFPPNFIENMYIMAP